MLAHLLWLAHRPRLSGGLKWQLLQQYGDPERVYFAESYEEMEGLRQEDYESLMDKSLSGAQKILETCLKDHLQILTIEDPRYPEKLKNIWDPPLILYYKGKLPDFNGNASVSVVGTRKATAYGLQAARRMGWQVAKCGGILVSGMALGIDAMAMEGALAAGGTAVGVLGCGADVIYPLKNRNLFQDTERYGCILSELPPGTPAAAWNFPRRNRIISGLSDGVLVVEAPQKSGALITARQALEQGRDVFVVPGNIGVSACEGSNQLLKDGASAVTGGWDILSQYAARYPGKLHEEALEPEMTKASLETVAQKVSVPKKEPKQPPKNRKDPPGPQGKLPLKQQAEEKLAIDNRGSAPYIDIDNILKKCNSQEKAIVLALADGELLVDDVILKTGASAKDVLASLTMLEIKGILHRLPGRYVSLQKK